jgi:hypothetical protein
VILLQRVINEIQQTKLDLVHESFRNPSLGIDGHAQFIKTAGLVRGLEMAVEIVEQLLKEDI